MRTSETDLVSFRSSIDADTLRPALLLAGTQVIISLVTAALLSSGALG
jgi:hypothetical protein